MSASSKTNIYRDREFIVAPIEGAVFPNRCVKTNAVVGAADFPLVIELLRSQIFDPDDKSVDLKQSTAALRRTGAARGAAKLAIELITKKKLNFTVGMSESLKARNRKCKLFGILLLIAGPLLGGGLAVAILNITQQMYGAPSAPLAGGAAAVGILMFIAGIVLFAVSALGTLRVKHSDGAFIWFHGGGSDFVASLPDINAE